VAKGYQLLVFGICLPQKVVGRTRKSLKLKQVMAFSGVEEIFKEDYLAVK